MAPFRALIILAVCDWFSFIAAPISKADTTWNYAVQISATVQSAPPQITLTWPQDDYGAIRYTVYRKAKGDTSWGTGTVLSGATTNYTDTSVVEGATYEYQIVKDATMGYRGFGYIFSGIQAPLTEDRGKLILIVENRYATALTNELARLQSDLTGDGWTVIRHEVSTNDTPASVRNLIIADYNQDPANVNTVFLFGHVPILHSGNLNYDGHLARPMPADAYYGDVNGSWSASPGYLPSDVKLMVGRADMFDMPGNFAPIPWPSEAELLRNYLNKDHNSRQKLVTVPHLALMGDRRGAEGGLATAASGYRNFQPLLGPNTTIQANIDDVAAPEARWGPILDAASYLWAYGCGAGSPTSVGYLGTYGAYDDLYSFDVVGQDAKAVFVMLFGSWFGNWDGTDNLMRSFLATPSLGLTCCLAGVPHWFVHHMGLGETIGYSTRLSMNNSTLYQSQSNTFTRAVYISLMGDPTLRMDPVAPPSALSAVAAGGGVTLNWQASADAILGYHVYRSASPSGPFGRLTGSLVAGNTFTDTAVSSNTYTYLVRAVTLQTTPSGSYYNASQGAFATIDVVNAALRIQLSASPDVNGLALSWNSQIGAGYRVLAETNLNQTGWVAVSGRMTATGTNTSWTDANFNSQPQRFYRISSP
ncbi:MAG TPA: fibronectin type III domain-containing protein [Candidatus Acidoferrum sp.]|nr:fibronectin type III domain-containing protein [Candidatus Acidoferrum sp.]